MKPRIALLTATVAIGMLSLQPAQAQWFVPDYSYGYGFGAYGSPYAFGGGTPASFEMQAMADMTRAQGAYNQMTGAGMADYEKARSQYIENEKQWTELYAMQQRVRQEQRAQKEQDRRDRVARRDSRPPEPANLPTRLMSSQLDRSSGQINWPEPLQADSFADGRKALEALFASRAHTGTTAELTEAIGGKVKELHAELRRHIRDLPTKDYIEARKFLDGLSVEGRAPLG